MGDNFLHKPSENCDRLQCNAFPLTFPPRKLTLLMSGNYNDGYQYLIVFLDKPIKSRLLSDIMTIDYRSAQEIEAILV